MFLEVLCWIINERKKSKQNDHRSDDANASERSITYILIGSWGFLETIILAVVMITKTGDFGENFFHGLCSHSSCNRIVFNAIVYKIVCSNLLVIGSITVSEFRFVPPHDESTI